MTLSIYQLACTILMWPMLWSVPILYANSNPTYHTNAILITTVTLLEGFVCWLAIGYYLSYHTYPTMHHLEPVLLQACFFLYAVVMLVGTFINKLKWTYILGFVPLWMVLVYAPMAFLLWHPDGWLAQSDALDFSGGLVVHLTAGMSSLVIARWFTIRSPHPTNSPIENPVESPHIISFIASLLIWFGWFGFNLGPLSPDSAQLGLVVTNTIVAVIASCASIVIYTKHPTIKSVSDGIIIGLVSSTGGAAYISPFAMFITAFIGGWVVAIALTRVTLDDPVDSFAMNALGGGIGSLSLLFFAHPNLTPDGQSGLFYGWQPHFLLWQLSAVFITLTISSLGTALILYLLRKQAHYVE